VKFIEPFSDKKVYLELDNDPEVNLSKEDLLGYKNEIKVLCEAFFQHKDDNWLNSNSIIYDKIKNLDIIFMQVRHIRYHVGHCNSILRENNQEAVDWLDYYGE
jgi:hypothetical protein